MELYGGRLDGAWMRVPLGLSVLLIPEPVDPPVSLDPDLALPDIRVIRYLPAKTWLTARPVYVTEELMRR